MIRYALRCENGHDFDSWFRSSDGYGQMRDAGQIACAICGSTSVDKALMAPALPAEKTTEKTARPDMPRHLTQPANPAEAALEKLRHHVETHSDYVGLSFADEARAMHEGRSPGRAIYGEARPDEARKLIEDGVPVAPLPFRPRQKTN